MTTSLAVLLEGLSARRADKRAVRLEDVDVDDVTIDSRKVRFGRTLFVACPGATPASKDGHAFLDAAVDAGAPVVVVTDVSRAQSVMERAVVVIVDDARRTAAILAERVAGSPSSALSVVGVTGTNGKTTTTWLVAQLAQHAGKRSAVLGTLGVGPVDKPRSLGFTTPEAEVISRELARLRAEGTDVVAMEVSSHALATARVDGLRFAAAGFTNLTRDHLDFHGTMEAYFDAKARLFTSLAPSAPHVIPAHDDRDGLGRSVAGTGGSAEEPATRTPGKTGEYDGWSRKLRSLSRADAITWGAGGRLSAVDVKSSSSGMTGTLTFDGKSAKFSSPLLGGYNVENLLVAAGCALSLGISLDAVAAGLASAVPPPGRLQRVPGPGKGPLVVVDYAHSPDALERALLTIRSVCAGRVYVVFGCGGDRDAGKRPIMGRIAGECADAVVVTDDNPRSENGDAIADAAVAGVKGKKLVDAKDLARGTVAKERARRMAIRAAVGAAGDDDAVLIAGKGHERTQTVGTRVMPFDDVVEASRALHHQSSPAIVDAALVRSATHGSVVGELPQVFNGVTTDSRNIEPGSLFIALAGERFDAHAFVKQALDAGAAAAVVSQRVEGARPLVVVDETLRALQDLAKAHLKKLPGRRLALTGSNGKTTTKELLAACLRAAFGGPWVLATEGNLNNHIGVPLTALRCEPEHRAMVFELGMNHALEIALLAEIVRPEVGLVTNMGSAHSGNFADGVEGVARAKAELFEALPKDGVAVVNADDPRVVREAQRAAKCKHISFGKAPWADVKLVHVSDRESGGQELEISHGSTTVETSIPLEGRHNAQNAAGAVAAAVALGLPFDVVARGLAEVHHAHGRLERFTLRGNVWLLDDTYNANPDSMEAAFEALQELAGGRRKIVVLGEMRELGQYAEQAHRHIGAAVGQSGVHALFCCGDLAKLYVEGATKAGLAPSATTWTPDNTSLAPLVATALADGDVVLVKGSRGARMEVVVDALRRARS